MCCQMLQIVEDLSMQQMQPLLRGIPRAWAYVLPNTKIVKDLQMNCAAQEVGYLTRCQSENVVQLIGYDYGVRQGTPQYSLKIATEWMSKNLEDVMGTCRMVRC